MNTFNPGGFGQTQNTGFGGKTAPAPTAPNNRKGTAAGNFGQQNTLGGQPAIGQTQQPAFGTGLGGGLGGGTGFGQTPGNNAMKPAGFGATPGAGTGFNQPQ